MYVLDTNTLIYYFKGMGQVGDRLLNASPADIAVPTLVLFELQAESAALIRVELEQRGLPIGPIDRLIAGIA